MNFLPVPLDKVSPLRVFWEPWVRLETRRGDGQADEDVIRDIDAGRYAIVLIWDDEGKASRGVIGIQVEENAQKDKVAHLVFCIGHEMSAWVDLFPELERIAYEWLGCKYMKATARPGWLRLFKAHGYSQTHVVVKRKLPWA